MSPSHVKKPLRARFFCFSNIGVLSLVAFALLLLLFPQNVCALNIILDWKESTKGDLAGYRVFCRQEGQSYNYNQPAWEGTDTTCPIYALDDEATYCFVVRAFNTSDNESADSNEVCYQANSLPTADAGPDQTVDEGVIVTLSGIKSSDPDDGIAAYLWTQTGGTSVTLSDVNAVQATFTAPHVGPEGESLTFELTVIDNSSLQSTDMCTVVVDDIPKADPDGQYIEDFEGYGAGDDPDDWLDTEAGNSMVEDDSLFKVFELSGEKVFGTTSTQTNIHSHYVGPGSDAFTSYKYTGRMMITAANGGIGVTFLSQYPTWDAYYRLRRHGSTSFHIAPHGTSVAGDTDTGVVPSSNVWYRFRIEVVDTGTRTEIRARVWQDGTAEPLDWQVDAIDENPTRLTAGTIGLWSHTSGSKYWDDLAVNP